MKSISLYTEEMDDLEVGVAELLEKMKDFPLMKNSAGILFAHPDTDFEELMARLKKELDFPIIGSTAISMFTQYKGYTTQGISLQIFTADDVEFNVGMTSVLNKDNIEAEIKKLYDELAAKQSEKEKLIISYGNIIPGTVGDSIIKAIDIASNYTPIYGGISSDYFTFEDCRIMFNERVERYAVAMILLSGNLRPTTIYEYSIKQEADYSAIANECTLNSVGKLGKHSYSDAMKRVGLDTKTEEDFTDAVGMPIMATFTTRYGDEISVMRHQNSVNQENGAGIFIGHVPEGSLIHICLLNRADIKRSVQQVVKKAFDAVHAGREEGYEYSTILVTSCASRIMTFVNDVQVEADGYVSVIPKNMSMSGMYSFGEFCPTYGENTGMLYNVFHNTTFTMLIM